MFGEPPAFFPAILCQDRFLRGHIYTLLIFGEEAGVIGDDMRTRLVHHIDTERLEKAFSGDMRGVIDKLDLAIVVVERMADGRGFRICAANTAFGAQAGVDAARLEGSDVADLLPADQAVQLLYRLRKCAGTGLVMTCPELISLPAGDLVREATFIPARRDHLPEDTPPRVLWAGLKLERVEHDDRDRRAFDDVRYYSADAARQIGQVTAALEAIGNSPANQQRLQPAALTLAAICRSAEQSLNRIDERSEHLIGMAEAPATYLAEARRLHDEDGYLSAMRGVVQDLINLVAPGADHLQGGDAHGTLR